MNAEGRGGACGGKRGYFCEEVFAELIGPVGFTRGRIAGKDYELQKRYNVSLAERDNWRSVLTGMVDVW